MELNTQQIARLRALTKEQIGELILKSGQQMGLSPQKAAMLARHSGSLYKKLQKMSDGELQRLAGMLGEKQVKDLLSNLE